MNSTESFIQEKRKQSHPIVYLFIMLPFGITGGYVQITLAFLLGRVGVSMSSIGALSIAILFIGVLKFLFGPIVDGFLTLKKWCLISGIFTAIGMLALGILPVQASSLSALIWIILAGNVAVSFLGISVGGLAAHNVPEELKGRVSGYINTGNLGGVGLGGGVGLWLAERMSNPLMPAAILALVCLLCSLGLFYIDEPANIVRNPDVGKNFKNLLKDIWDTIKTRVGLLAMLLSFMPLGTGALQGYWSGAAGSWHASAATVEFVQGIFSGLITAGGCLIGGWICDRFDRKLAYLTFGLLLALNAVTMAYCPHTEIMFKIWTSVYAFILGLCYAGFSAFVFEVIGKGAAGTKYTFYACLSNIPILYMTKIEGLVFDSNTKLEATHGPTGMLNSEALFGVLGIIIFLIVFKIFRTKKAATN